MLSLQLCLQQVLKVRAEGEYLQTIFPAAEALLFQTDVQEALSFVSGQKRMDRYKSIMDYLFCETAGEPWPGRCQRFYNGKCLAVREMLPQSEIEEWDRVLCELLGFAVRCWEAQVKMDWTKFIFWFQTKKCPLPGRGKIFGNK